MEDDMALDVIDFQGLSRSQLLVLREETKRNLLHAKQKLRVSLATRQQQRAAKTSTTKAKRENGCEDIDIANVIPKSDNMNGKRSSNDGIENQVPSVVKPGQDKTEEALAQLTTLKRDRDGEIRKSNIDDDSKQEICTTDNEEIVQILSTPMYSMIPFDTINNNNNNYNNDNDKNENSNGNDKAGHSNVNNSAEMEGVIVAETPVEERILDYDRSVLTARGELALIGGDELELAPRERETSEFISSDNANTNTCIKETQWIFHTFEGTLNKPKSKLDIDSNKIAHGTISDRDVTQGHFASQHIGPSQCQEDTHPITGGGTCEVLMQINGRVSWIKSLSDTDDCFAVGMLKEGDIDTQCDHHSEGVTAATDNRVASSIEEKLDVVTYCRTDSPHAYGESGEGKSSAIIKTSTSLLRRTHYPGPESIRTPQGDIIAEGADCIVSSTPCGDWLLIGEYGPDVMSASEYIDAKQDFENLTILSTNLQPGDDGEHQHKNDPVLVKDHFMKKGTLSNALITRYSPTTHTRALDVDTPFTIICVSVTLDLILLHVNEKWEVVCKDEIASNRKDHEMFTVSNGRVRLVLMPQSPGLIVGVSSSKICTWDLVQGKCTLSIDSSSIGLSGRLRTAAPMMSSPTSLLTANSSNTIHSACLSAIASGSPLEFILYHSEVPQPKLVRSYHHVGIMALTSTQIIGNVVNIDDQKRVDSDTDTGENENDLEDDAVKACCVAGFGIPILLYNHSSFYLYATNQSKTKTDSNNNNSTRNCNLVAIGGLLQGRKVLAMTGCADGVIIATTEGWIMKICIR